MVSHESAPKHPSPKRELATLIIGLAMALMVAGTLAYAFITDPPQPPAVAKTEDRPVVSLQAGLPEAIVKTRDYLNRIVDEQGRFVYRKHVDGKRYDPAKYNILRHAGSVYALSMLAQRDAVDAPTRSTILRAAHYLLERNYSDVDGVAGAAAIFSLPAEENGVKSGHREAKLGGTALGIIALLAARELEPSLVDLAKIQALGRFIVFMQQPDGSFRAKYSERRQFEVDFHSLYYPGEAILALMRLYQADPDPQWLRTAAKAAAYLVESRKGSATLPPDHWLLIATNELLERYGDLRDPPIAGDEIYRHAVAIAETMLEDQRKVAAQGGPKGSFLADGRCTPTTTRLEGLIALEALATRRNDIELRQRLRRSLVEGGRFALQCLHHGGKLDGGVLHAAAKKSDTPENRKFNRMQGEIRIDYVQHALSAYIGIASLCESTDACDA